MAVDGQNRVDTTMRRWGAGPNEKVGDRDDEPGEGAGAGGGVVLAEQDEVACSATICVI